MKKAILFFLIVSAIFHFSTPNVADIDSFFYIGLASIYRDGGIFNVDFPWLQRSVIKDLSSSLWYGFGILLIPFTIFQDPAIGIKIAGLILTTAALLAFYWVIKKLDVKNPFFWTFFMFFAGPNSMSHFLRTRPQTISLTLLPLFFYFVVKKKFWWVALTAFGISWAHLNFAWAPIAVFLAIAAVKLIIERDFDWKSGLATVTGILLGWILRPDFWLAAKLFYIQIAKQILEKQGGLPLLFGSENIPFTVPMFIEIFFVFLIVFVTAAVFLFRSFRQMDSHNKVVAISALGISLVFLILTLAVARRAHDLMVIFGMLGAAVILNRLRDTGKLLLTLALIIAVLYSGIRTAGNLAKKYPPDYLKEPATWLKENSNPGDVVFNLHWSNFSPLFAWNHQNYYVGGLDPIFQYEYNPELYWKFHYLSADLVTKKTCAKEECELEDLEDTHQALVRDFGAKYVMLEKDQNPAVYFFMNNDIRFEKKFENKREAIFLVKQ